jgi:hypothetical protein
VYGRVAQVCAALQLHVEHHLALGALPGLQQRRAEVPQSSALLHFRSSCANGE